VRLPRSLVVLVAVLVAMLVVASPSAARAEPAVDLYTVGQGSYLYASYGHSILCVRDEADKPGAGKGTCYDYGVADKPDVLYVLWASLRGRAIFTPVTLDDRALMGFFTNEGRAIERQSLPLAKPEARALAERLASDVRERWSYAYHPYTANCASQLRDRIDAATGGRLHAGGVAAPLTYRQQMERGLSGRMFELMATSLVLGPASDRTPDAWEAMYLPDGLRDGVTARFGVKAELLAERQAVILPTSAGAGRFAMFVLAFLLFVTIRLGARTKRLGAAVLGVGVVLGLFALAVDVMALASSWVELSRTWALVVLLPTDLALGWMKGPLLRTYVRARLAVVLGVALLELASVISQPMLASVALVALPLAGLLGALRADATAGEKAPKVDAARTARAA
jgi:hypothetical protein